MTRHKTAADMQEGQEALDRFRKAMKTIVSVPKSAVVPVPARKTRSPRKNKTTK
jgi:hypothetical protein